ncbi:hypothetical protein WICPIJ_006186 [Wickerhamomyces pijperi]|uniref:BTB domain-containing protein n=1 Tax=Wickerhamomyces pijperi TaxID=599730 RepID=A0A9P8Q2A8_WICPI|nr:hypothetical protein WICPIJ_006186 [Wickerhamomyces pijperi]
MSFNHDSITKKLRKLSKKQLQKRDIFGRTILHIICITGRFELLKELLLNPNLNATITDLENGWTGLHTSIYYGKFSCAKILLDFHYDLVKMKDRNSLTALDIYHLKYSYKDLNIFPDSINQENSLHFEKRFKEKTPLTQNLQWWDSDLRGGSEVYSFGVNVNNNLGTGDSVDKLKYPVNIEIPNFRINDMEISLAERLVKPRIKDFKISKNHSIILTNEPVNNILICGNPARGRLGISSISPVYRFTNMESLQDETIVEVAVSEDHSLALNNKGEIFSWGSNNVGQLGYGTEKSAANPFSSEPRKITHTALKKLHGALKGVSCSKIHSVAFSNTDVVLWGLNIGQMDILSSGESAKVGKFKGIIQSPRRIEFQSTIRQVIAMNEATIVLLQSNECHILINNNHIKIPLPEYRSLNNEFEKFRPKQFSKRREIVKICSKRHSNIAILYNDGFVCDFSIDPSTIKTNVGSIKFNEIWKPTNNHLKCVDVDIGSDGSVVICTKSGCVFKRGTRSGESKKGFKFSKVAKISKVVKVACDDLFTSFGFIRDDVDQLPLKLKLNSFRRDIACLSPLVSARVTVAKEEGEREGDEVSIDSDRSAHTTDYYTMDFLHKGTKKPLLDSEEEEDLLNLLQTRFTAEEQQETETVCDPLLKAYKSRWSQPQQIKTTTTVLSSREDPLHLLCSDDFEVQYSVNNYNMGKNYNISFEIGQFSVGAHDSILKFDDQLSLLHSQDLCIDQDIVFHQLQDGVIKVEGVDVRSLLIVLDVFYSGELLKPWDQSLPVSESESNFDSLIAELKATQTTTMKILKKLQIVDELNRLKFDLCETYQAHSDNFENDITIRLADDESIECCSFVLCARSEYFDTLLSSRWGQLKQLEFVEFDKSSFEIILDYIYGAEQLSLLDHLHFDTINDFVNHAFNLIELADELLLFELKDFFQLMIKDFINVENVLVILQNSEVLNCQKLTKECLYFIYHNFDLVLMDPQYDEELLTTKTFSAIDEYAHEFNKLNQVSTITSIPWFEDNQLMLISHFLSDDPREFNDIFLEHDNFVPLFDVKQTPISESASSTTTSASTSTGSTTGNKTKKERQPSIPSVSPLTEKALKPRKSSVVSLESKRPGLNYGALSRNASVGNESVVDFVDDDDFQPVVNSRRRKSSTNKATGLGMSNHNVSASSDAQRLSVPLGVSLSSSSSSIYSTRNQSTSSIISDQSDSNIWPGINSSNASSIATGTKPSSSSTIPWNIPTPVSASTTASSSLAADYSTSPRSFASSSSASSASNASPWGLADQSTSTRDTAPAPKITINRLSQKERRKLSRVNDTTESKKSDTPWKLPTTSKPSTSNLGPSQPQQRQPSLLEIARSEQLKEHKLNQPSTPSLKGIIHEEQHKIILDKQTKSLAEIQQEEEFNLWWENESKKVRASQNPSHLNTSTKQKKNGNNAGNGNIGNGTRKKSTSSTSKSKTGNSKQQKSKNSGNSDPVTNFNPSNGQNNVNMIGRRAKVSDS